MKALVTGGAGFIGSHIVDALITQGVDVVVLDSLVNEVHGDRAYTGVPPDYLNPKAEFRFKDIVDRMAVLTAVNGVEAVFHCASRLGVQRSFERPSEFMADNVLGTAVLLEAAASAGVKTFVLSSSMGVYGEGLYRCENCTEVTGKLALRHPEPRDVEHFEDARTYPREHAWDPRCSECDFPLVSHPTLESTGKQPTSIYSMTKLSQEDLALHLTRSGQLNGMKVVVLRYFNAFGPRQALSNPYSGVGAIFANSLMNGESPKVYEDGHQTRDFVYVSDIVDANLAALQESVPSCLVNIGTGKGTELVMVASTFAAALAPKVLPKIVKEGRLGDIRHSVADIRLAKAVLGFEPKVEFEEGVFRTCLWLTGRSNGSL